LILLAFFVLAGCVSLPKDEQTEHLLSAPGVDKRATQESPFFTKGKWPDQQWWKTFHSDQLTVCIERALARNPSILAIQERVRFAKEMAIVEKATLFPLLFFDADETWQYLSHHGLYRSFNHKLPINPNLVDLSLSFTYEFDFWGKNRNLFHAALGKEKASEAEAAEVQLIITTSVTQAYFALKTNLIKRKLYQQLLDVRRGIFQLQSLLEEKALLSKLPPLLSEEDVFRAEKDLFAIQEEIAVDQHLMNILMGAAPDQPIELDEFLSEMPSSIALPENLSIDLLARRPDLMAQIWRVEALAHEAGAAKADFYPDITLTAFGGLESTFYAFLFHGSSIMGGLKPAFHLPIFTAGSIRANFNAKKAAFDEAVYEYNKLLLQSAQEVSDLFAIIQSIFSQKQKQTKIVENALERLELTSLRQRSGLDNQLERYSFEEAMILQQLIDIDLLYSQYLVVVKLIKSLGGGYISEYIPLTAQEKG
jgi:NodT family efflux transporter outer membrane factor (OMF) lipoprotein